MLQCTWKASGTGQIIVSHPGTGLSISQLLRVEHDRGGHPTLRRGLHHDCRDRICDSRHQSEPPSRNRTCLQPHCLALSPSYTRQPSIFSSALSPSHDRDVHVFDKDNAINKMQRRHASQKAPLFPLKVKKLSPPSRNKAADVDTSQLVWPEPAQTITIAEAEKALAELESQRNEREKAEQQEREIKLQKEQTRRRKIQEEQERRLEVKKERRLARERWWNSQITPLATRLVEVATQLELSWKEYEEDLRHHAADRKMSWERAARRVEARHEAVYTRYNGKWLEEVTSSSTHLRDAIVDVCDDFYIIGKGPRSREIRDRKTGVRAFDLFAAEGLHLRQKKALFHMRWLSEPLSNFSEEIGSLLHVLRHVRRAARLYELHPRAFAYKADYGHFYYHLKNLVTESELSWEGLKFFEVNALLSFEADAVGFNKSDAWARRRRRFQLAGQLKEGNHAIAVELRALLDQGNSFSHTNTAGSTRPQQNAVIKPFNLYMSGFQTIPDLSKELGQQNDRPGPLKCKMDRILRLLRLLDATKKPMWQNLEHFIYWNWSNLARNSHHQKVGLNAIGNSALTRVPRQLSVPVPQFFRPEGSYSAWRYTDFRGPKGEQVVVKYYCVDNTAAETAACELLQHDILAIDVWGGRPFADIDEAIKIGNSLQRATPMVAIATEERITLFHYGAGYLLTRGLGRRLQSVLGNPNIIKVCTNREVLQQRMNTYPFLAMDGCVDLDSIDTTVPPSGEVLAERKSPTTLSDRMLRHFGQPLRDDIVDPQGLEQVVTDARKLQFLASRVYAIWKLYQSLNQRAGAASPRSDSDNAVQASAKSYVTVHAITDVVKSRSDNKATGDVDSISSISSSPKHSRILGADTRLADYDLGPVFLDHPSNNLVLWLSDVRRLEAMWDKRLDELATGVANVLETKTTIKISMRNLKAFVLFTTFNQSCEDIQRIFAIARPAEALLDAIKIGDLPIDEGKMQVLESERARSPEWRVRAWLDTVLANSPTLLRLKRRQPRIDRALVTYGMWHFELMDVREIARLTGKLPKTVYSQIKELKSKGVLALLPMQRERWLSLLRECDKEEYELEIKLPSTDVSTTPSSWGQAQATSFENIDPRGFEDDGSLSISPLVRYSSSRKDEVLVRKTFSTSPNQDEIVSATKSLQKSKAKTKSSLPSKPSKPVLGVKVTKRDKAKLASKVSTKAKAVKKQAKGRTENKGDWLTAASEDLARGRAPAELTPPTASEVLKKTSSGGNSRMQRRQDREKKREEMRKEEKRMVIRKYERKFVIRKVDTE